MSSREASNVHIEDLNFTPFIERIRSKLARLASLDDSGTMPDLATEDAGLLALAGRPCDLGRTIAHHSKVFHDSMKVASYGRRLFRTTNGFLRLGSKSLRVGDAVVLATGSDVPLLLRPVAHKPNYLSICRSGLYPGNHAWRGFGDLARRHYPRVHYPRVIEVTQAAHSLGTSNRILDYMSHSWLFPKL